MPLPPARARCWPRVTIPVRVPHVQEVLERARLAEEAKRLRLRKQREAQMRERADAGFGVMDLSGSQMATVPKGASAADARVEAVAVEQLTGRRWPAELFSGAEAWTRWGMLISLDLSNNFLVSLPERGMLYPLSSLIKLDLSKNRLIGLPVRGGLRRELAPLADA